MAVDTEDMENELNVNNGQFEGEGGEEEEVISRKEKGEKRQKVSRSSLRTESSSATTTSSSNEISGPAFTHLAKSISSHRQTYTDEEEMLSVWQKVEESQG